MAKMLNLHRLQLLLRRPLRPVVRFLLFFFYDTYYVDGPQEKLHIGHRVGMANTLCNVASGSIHIGDHCAFGYNVMLLTGRHRFLGGRRASLRPGDGASGWGGDEEEVPSFGYDIRIGDGTWIASGVIITGGVSIGRHAIVAANAVVTRDIPDYAIASGVPARVTGDTRGPARQPGERAPDAV